MVTFRGGDGRFKRPWKIFVIVLVVALSWSFYWFASWVSSPTRDLPEISVFGSDSFDQVASSVDSAGDSELQWSVLVGEWERWESALRSTSASAVMNLVVVNAGSQASIKARVTGVSYCGLAANVSSADNYVALLRAKPYGIWNVVEVVSGESKRRGTLPDPGTSEVDAQLRVGDGKVWAFVGPSVATFSLETNSVGTSSGFAQWGDSSPSCSFDDAVVMVPN